MKPLPAGIYIICDSEDEVNELQEIYPLARVVGDPLSLHFAVGEVHYGRIGDMENEWAALSSSEVSYLEENCERSSRVLFEHFKQYMLPLLQQ